MPEAIYGEDDLLPLSGLQHFTFCERRWALVQVESLWAENQFTAEGRVLHDRAHSAELESRPGVLIRRTLPLRSFQLGISGQADIVEFEPVPSGQPGVAMENRSGRWKPFPIEYKRRKDRSAGSPYRIQLCAQAICLEEMLGIPVKNGAIYDGTTRRRTPVEFTPELRQSVERAAARMHELHRLRITPPPVYTAACEKCSMLELCQPRARKNWNSVEQYFAGMLTAESPE
jgi:CRISPR-associated exonuclease Cas4